MTMQKIGADIVEDDGVSDDEELQRDLEKLHSMLEVCGVVLKTDKERGRKTVLQWYPLSQWGYELESTTAKAPVIVGATLGKTIAYQLVSSSIITTA